MSKLPRAFVTELSTIECDYSKVAPCGCDESNAMREILESVVECEGPCDGSLCSRNCIVCASERLLATLAQKREAIATHRASSLVDDAELRTKLKARNKTAWSEEELDAYLRIVSEHLGRGQR